MFSGRPVRILAQLLIVAALGYGTFIAYALVGIAPTAVIVGGVHSYSIPVPKGTVDAYLYPRDPLLLGSFLDATAPLRGYGAASIRNGELVAENIIASLVYVALQDERGEWRAYEPGDLELPLDESPLSRVEFFLFYLAILGVSGCGVAWLARWTGERLAGGRIIPRLSFALALLVPSGYMILVVVLIL